MYEQSIIQNKKYILGNSVGLQLYNEKDIPFPEGFFDKIFTVNTIYF